MLSLMKFSFKKIPIISSVECSYSLCTILTLFKREKVITGNPVVDNQIVRDIYGVNNLDQLASLSVQQNYARFKKSTKLKTDVINIMGWVKLVQYRAKETIVRSTGLP